MTAAIIFFGIVAAAGFLMAAYGWVMNEDVK